MLKDIWQDVRRGWHAWTCREHKIGNFQARVLLTALYALMVLPFGLAVRWFGDPLRIKRRQTHWLEHPNETCDMSWGTV